MERHSFTSSTNFMEKWGKEDTLWLIVFGLGSLQERRERYCGVEQ